MPRRTRKLDYPGYKASEWRNLAMFCFPIILESFLTGRFEVKLWGQLAYLLRAYSLPNPEFLEVSKEFLESLLERFYRRFCDAYGDYSCRFNLHLVQIKRITSFKHHLQFLYIF